MKTFLIIILSMLSFSLYAQIYHPNDSLELLKIEANCDITNQLNWNTEPNPQNWEGITWDSSTPKRVYKMEIGGKSLSGAIDLTPFDSITLLQCSTNYIDSLILNNLTKLNDVRCSQNNLSYLDISNSTMLQTLDCSENKLTELNLTTQIKLWELSCYRNLLTKLDLSANYYLSFLECSHNQLTELDISGQPGMDSFDASSNQLTKLKIGNHYSIQYFDCSDNQLSEIDLYGVKDLMGCRITNNKLPFSSLAAGLNAKYLTYSPQKSLFEPIIREGDTIIDYSSEAVIRNTATEFKFFKDKKEMETNATGLYTTVGPGVYYCEMSNSLFPDCTLQTETVTITEVTENESLSVCPLSYYPNPTAGILHLNSYYTHSISELRIYNSEGKELRCLKELTLPYDIDLTNFKSGIYWLKFVNTDSSIQFSILKK